MIFEAAVAAAFLGRPLTLFVSSQYLFNLKTLGQVRVVAPLLYCDGHSEPFRPYGHSIMQREKKQQGGREEAAEIRPSATRLPTAVGCPGPGLTKLCDGPELLPLGPVSRQRARSPGDSRQSYTSDCTFVRG